MEVIAPSKFDNIWWKYVQNVSATILWLTYASFEAIESHSFLITQNESLIYHTCELFLSFFLVKEKIKDKINWGKMTYIYYFLTYICYFLTYICYFLYIIFVTFLLYFYKIVYYYIIIKFLYYYIIILFYYYIIIILLYYYIIILLYYYIIILF